MLWIVLTSGPRAHYMRGGALLCGAHLSTDATEARVWDPRCRYCMRSL
jgi:hypothetical protein